MKLGEIEAMKRTIKMGETMKISRLKLLLACSFLVSMLSSCAFFSVDFDPIPNTNGTGVFLVQGEPGDPANRRVYMDKAQAAAEPIEKSTAQVRQETQNQPQAQQEREQRRTLGI